MNSELIVPPAVRNPASFEMRGRDGFVDRCVCRP